MSNFNNNNNVVGIRDEAYQCWNDEMLKCHKLYLKVNLKTIFILHN